MINFWIAITLASLFCIGYLWIAIKQQISVSQHSSLQLTKAKLVFLLPVAVIALSPVLYLSWQSYQQQSDWQSVQQKTTRILTSGDVAEVQLTLQELMLGLRSQAFENPNNGQIWFELGKAYINLQMKDVALMALRRAIKLERNPDWLVAISHLLTTTGEIEDTYEAIGFLKEAIANAPEHQNALLTLGFVEFKLENYAQAIGAWEALLAIDSFPVNSRQLILQQITRAKGLAGGKK